MGVAFNCFSLGVVSIPPSSIFALVFGEIRHVRMRHGVRAHDVTVVSEAPDLIVAHHPVSLNHSKQRLEVVLQCGARSPPALFR